MGISGLGIFGLTFSVYLCQGVHFLQKRGYKQALHNFQNVQYYADFVVGGQKIAGIFDTGSFELLVRSSQCQECVHPTPPYDRKLSDTYVENGTITKHVFGSGPCVSVMGYDNVTVGSLHAPRQAFWEIIEHQIAVLDSAKFAAIVGIGPNFGYGNTEKTLLTSLGIDEFSICLQKPSGSEGYLTWGPTEWSERHKRGRYHRPLSRSIFAEDYAWARVIGEHHWATRLQNVTFIQNATDGHLANVPCGVGDGCVAILDSGTSLIAAPGMALMQLSEQIPPIKEDCSNLHELPVLRFVVDGTVLELPPQAYVMHVTGASLEAEDIWDLLFFKPKIRKVNICMPAFMQIDMVSKHGPVWILGMPFFRYYHTTFDRKNQAMYISSAGPNCEPRPLHSGKNSESNATFLAMEQELDRTAMDIDVAALVPPRLAEMMDYPFRTAGELVL